MKSEPSIFRLLTMTGAIVILLLVSLRLSPLAEDSKLAPFEIPLISTWTNSLGMEFVVGLKPRFRACRWETRVQDFRVFAQESSATLRPPVFGQAEDHPVVGVSWHEAQQFCVWLTKRERDIGLISEEFHYRLPTDREWTLLLARFSEPYKSPRELDEDANGAYTWGTTWPVPAGAGNYGPDMGVDDFPFTSPVGSFAENAIGLFDLAGNVWEWCQDWYSPNQRYRVLRGGSWRSESYRNGLATERHAHLPHAKVDCYGFRCVIARVGESAIQ